MTFDDDPFLDAALHNGGALTIAMIRDAAVPIIGVEPHGIVLCWNDAASRFCGYSMPQMVGRPLDRIIPHGHRPALARKLSAIWDGGPPGQFNGCFITAAGKMAAAPMTASPVRDGQGSVIAASLILHIRDASAEATSSPGGQQRRKSILVMEDEALIGLGLVAMLENAGFSVMGPARDVPSATALLDRHPCALAILDTHLQGESSAPVARRLRADGIPFLVTSANPASARPAAFDGAPDLPRPWRTNRLVAAVHAALD